jgi:GTP-binding protein LepA
MDKIRTFSIIAHIDHGKSTLADRFLERAGNKKAKNIEQYLDQMDLERERGITIKSHPVSLDIDGFRFNIIDTPGHVDFSYEVSRALASCEGALLVVDATQGVEAQTLAHAYKAIENDLEIIPVINKIDLPAADPDRVKQEIEDLIGIDTSDAILVSAKMGWGIDELIEAIKERIPAPSGDTEKPLRALIFDSKYDNYRGVIIYVRVFDGVIRKGMKIKLMATGSEYEVNELGIFRPEMVQTDELGPGEVGWVAATIKNIRDAQVGDTVTSAQNPASEPIPGFRKVKPMVFAGLYPVESEDFEKLRDALQKLALNDAALFFQPENSPALGPGFRCGFLGLLHMEIVRERLEREFDLELVITTPNVIYRITKKNGEVIEAHSPADFPDPAEIELIEEPYVRGEIIVPNDYVGPVMQLAHNRRGIMVHMEYPSENRVHLTFDLPYSEIILDFFDQLKSVSRGFASFDYDFLGYRPADVVKVEILVNGKPVDALSFVAPKDYATRRAREVLLRLKKVIPRQLFEIALQAKVGGRIVARENIRPLKKDVLAKCYGGDVSRKKKLLQKQKEGKKRMKKFGRISIPQEAFLEVLKVDSGGNKD